MGLNYLSQLQRIQTTYPISYKLAYIEVNTLYQEGTRKRAVVHLNIEGLTYWVATIDEKRVKPEIQDRVRKFQRDAGTVGCVGSGTQSHQPLCSD